MQIVDIVEQQKIGYVRSCSECCSINCKGKPNVNGQLHCESLRRPDGSINCSICPVHLNISEDEWATILAEMDGCN